MALISWVELRARPDRSGDGVGLLRRAARTGRKPEINSSEQCYNRHAASLGSRPSKLPEPPGRVIAEEKLTSHSLGERSALAAQVFDRIGRAPVGPKDVIVEGHPGEI